MQISRLKSMFAQVSSTGNVAQAPPSAGTPTLTDPISQSCTAYQFHEEAYAYWFQQIGEKPRSNGKEREFCYVAPAFSLAGVLALGRTGLGLGVAPSHRAACSLREVRRSSVPTWNRNRRGRTVGLIPISTLQPSSLYAAD